MKCVLNNVLKFMAPTQEREERGEEWNRVKSDNVETRKQKRCLYGAAQQYKACAQTWVMVEQEEDNEDVPTRAAKV